MLINFVYISNTTYGAKLKSALDLSKQLANSPNSWAQFFFIRLNTSKEHDVTALPSFRHLRGSLSS